MQVMGITNNINEMVLLSWYPCCRVCWFKSVSYIKLGVLALVTTSLCWEAYLWS